MPYRVSETKVAWRLLEGEAVLVHVDTSEYFGINETGTLLWCELATHPMDLADMTAFLAARCADVSERIETEIKTFLNDLIARDLLEPASASAPAPSSSQPAASLTAYSPPALALFGELGKLILSGE